MFLPKDLQSQTFDTTLRHLSRYLPRLATVRTVTRLRAATKAISTVPVRSVIIRRDTGRTSKDTKNGVACQMNL